MDTPESIPSVPEQPFTNKKDKTFLVIVTMAIALLLVVMALIIIYLLSNSQIPKVTTNNQSNTTTPSYALTENKSTNATTEEYNGTFFNATLPAGWSIEEYHDVTGMKLAVQDPNITYTNLTGFVVIDENDQLIFSFKGVDGIGGLPACSTLVRFSDTEATYVQQIQEDTLSVLDEPTVVIDHLENDYTSITLFGKNFRRLGNKMYMSLSANSSVFNTGCGISEHFVTVDDVGFTITSSTESRESSSYDFEINSAVLSEDTLLKLDEVLNSII